LVVLFGALSAIAAAFLYRYEPRVKAAVPENVRPRIGGWALLLGLNVLVAPFRQAFFLIATGPAWRVLSASNWDALTTTGDPRYHPALAWVTLGEVLTLEALCAYQAVVALLFIQKRRGFMFHFMVCAIALLAYVGIDDMVAASFDHADAKVGAGAPTFVRQLIFTLLWCAYVTRSMRVRETFVRSRKDAAAPASMPEEWASAAMGEHAPQEPSTGH
jgi:hypothetical protein